MQADGAELTRLTDDVGTLKQSPTWSPDGRHIAFTSYRPGVNGSHIYVMDADGGNTKRVTLDPALGDAVNRSPSWSPDGSEIAFTSWRVTSEVFAVSPDGQQVRQITNDNMWNLSARWSPNGRRMAGN